jgi:hypothetical protein
LSLLTRLKKNPTTGKLEVDPLSVSPVLQNLVFCLGKLIRRNEDQDRKPTLVLLGDILELALADDNVAAMVFERFLEQAMPPGEEPLFDKTIFFIPGNHDHHLWESARETQYVSNYLPSHPHDPLEIPRHITKDIFMELVNDKNKVRSYFLNELMHRYSHLEHFTIYTAYPNFGLTRGDRAVIFHHGHFVESIYHLMTTLKNMIFPSLRKTPLTVDDLEAENFAWIDFFWSTLGRSGEVGHGVEIIYDKMLDNDQFCKLLDNLTDTLAGKYLSVWCYPGYWLFRKAIHKLLVHRLADKLSKPERTETKTPLGDDAAKGLVYYVNGPLRRQIDAGYPKPKLTTFVFGHTHKPFELYHKFWAHPAVGVAVYNTGGWVVETKETSPLHGGAAVLLNENLDIASLHLYNEADNRGGYKVEVHEPPQPGSSQFVKFLKNLIVEQKDCWEQFSQTVAGEVEVRRQILLDKIASQG